MDWVDLEMNALVRGSDAGKVARARRRYVAARRKRAPKRRRKES